MKLDIQTLALISCVTFVAQVIALLVQYIVNKTNRGIRWWLSGSALMAIGVIFMPLVYVKSLEMLARVANPLVVLGQILLYIGIVRFLDRKENKWVLISIFTAFILSYYYFMFFDNNISGRTFVLTLSMAALSFMTAFRLFFNKDRLISGSANFTAIVFFAYGCFTAVRFFWVIFSPRIQTYSDQGVILVLSFIVPIFAGALWTFGFIIMVNQLLNAENREEKEKLQLIFNTSPDAACITRLSDGLFVDVNSGFSVMSGYTRAEIIRKSSTKINIWHNLADRQTFINELQAKGMVENMEFIFQRKDGSRLTGSISAKIITISALPYIISVIHDITNRKLVEVALQESEELYRSILNASPDNITITDLKGRILMVSPAARKMFGYNENDEFIGLPLLDFIVPEDRERAQGNIILMFGNDYSGPNEYRGVRKDGSIFDVESNSGIIHDANGQPSKMVFIVRNITERKQAEQQIQQLVEQLEIEKNKAQFNANTDSLTKLANRRYFDEALSIEFYRLKRSGSPMSLIMLDVDYFKKFNDTYGHLAGDNCLKQIGVTIKRTVGRVTDFVARYGGEEFVAILTETEQRGAATLAERIRKAVEKLAIPNSASDISKYVTVSLGVVTVYTARLSSPQLVVALADEAMYRAKRGGRNRVIITTDKLEAPDSTK